MARILVKLTDDIICDWSTITFSPADFFRIPEAAKEFGFKRVERCLRNGHSNRTTANHKYWEPNKAGKNKESLSHKELIEIAEKYLGKKAKRKTGFEKMMEGMQEFTKPPKDGDYDHHITKAMMSVYDYFGGSRETKKWEE
jgi:hypothetical protein